MCGVCNICDVERVLSYFVKFNSIQHRLHCLLYEKLYSTSNVDSPYMYHSFNQNVPTAKAANCDKDSNFDNNTSTSKFLYLVQKTALW